MAEREENLSAEADRQTEDLAGNTEARSSETGSLAREAEESIRRIRRFRENLMTPFAKAVRTYDLLQPGDRVAVCISGGKDSMLMAKLFQELQRHRKFPFGLVFLCMDPGYAAPNRRLIEENAAAPSCPGITVFPGRRLRRRGGRKEQHADSDADRRSRGDQLLSHREERPGGLRPH